jgi:predicted MFS family arabinose efflux permease
LGRTVGLMQAGLLTGVLASRSYAGALASVAGWRAVFCCSCAATAALTLVLWRALPAVPRATSSGYREILTSLPRVFAADPLVRRVTLSGALIGVSFGAFWTALTFLLELHYHYGPATVGLFGLVAAASALASPYAGRLADRSGLSPMILVVLTGWAALLLGGTHLTWLTAGVVILDVGTWSNQVTCQRALFTLPTPLHSRLTTCYFTLRFLGIALGSLTATLAWPHGGWPAIVTTGATAATLALLIAVAPQRRVALTPGPGRGSVDV